MAGTLGTYVVEIDWGNIGTFTGTGDNVTSRALFTTWIRGRDKESQLTGRSQASRLTLLLNNDSGDYEDLNSGGPLFGSLEPARKIRIRATAPTAETLYTGFIESITPRADLRQLNIAEVAAIGPLGYINQDQIDIPLLLNVPTDKAVGTILDKASWPSADRSISTGQTTLTRFWRSDTYAMNALRAVEVSENGFIFETKDGKIGFHDRHARLKSPFTLSQDTFTDSSTGTLGYSNLVSVNPLPFIFNSIEIPVITYSTAALGTLWKMGVASADFPPIAPNGGTLVIWARHPNETSTLNVVAVDDWVTPTATADFTFNETTAGTGTNVTTASNIVVEKFSQAMKMTWTNTGSLAGFLTFSQARGNALTQTSALIREEDSDSQTAHGRRKYPSPAEFIPAIAEARDGALWILRVNKDKVPLIQMTVSGNRDSTHMKSIMSRDINDRITVIGTGSRSLRMDQTDFYIESERHVIDSHRRHTVTYGCSKAEGFSDWWTLNTSKLGTTTIPGY